MVRTETFPFRWSYIILPVAILLLSIILTAYFYPLLPTEVAIKVDGPPDKWMSRNAIIAWLLTPQLLLTLLAGAITWGITKLISLFRQGGGRGIEGIISLMGNMIALPQIILCFALLNIFIYNCYQIHIMPLGIFALIVMGVGGMIIGIFFIWVIRQVTKER
ncbi:DUF1648 domain-containing protein [Dehalococcoidales bacterium]|nr:DUF1648 domain-containing protein [Dehalococcoidales bacterium]